MWGLTKKAINSTVGTEMKTLDVISRENASQILYEMLRVASESGAIDGVLIVPKDPEMPYAFVQNNENIKNIIFSPETKTTSFEGIYACGEIKHLYMPHIEHIVGTSLVQNANLTSITLGRALKRIDRFALEYNDKLTHIYYEGTMEEWNAIIKGSYWDNETNLTKIVCVDGTIDHIPSKQ